MDPDNPVVKLCAEGARAEIEGRYDDARDLIMRAWAARRDDYDACVAAHFVARHQESPEEALRWNQAALEHADRDASGGAAGFYPSLYLNLGYSHEMLGDIDQAARCYETAAGLLDRLPAGPYRDMVHNAVARGRLRIAMPRDAQAADQGEH
jgi:tetratricopeptide (TPR) repeat protein